MTKINWKVRFKNKVFLASFFALILSFVYGMLQLFDVYPPITENQISTILNQFLNVLALIGIIADPTTSGLNDSDRAMGYIEPWQDEPDEQ